MKRLFYLVCFAATVLAIVAGSFTARIAVSHAATTPMTGKEAVKQFGPGNPLAAFEQTGISRPRDLRYTIANLVRVALGFVGIILLILTLYAGFLWFSARGNEEQVTKAKAVLKNSVIGLVIIMLSYSITLFVTRVVFAPEQENPATWTGVGEQFVPEQQSGDTSAPYQYQRSR